LLASETTGRAGRKTTADNLWAKAHLTPDLNKNEGKRVAFISRTWDRTQDLQIEANGTNRLGYRRDLV
jgi:hypothetical protein